jgi:UDP-glucose:glycoprotein glucosyltransferase
VEKELYTKFLELLQSDGHITDPETLASFKFALSVRSAAPRIQAHYQYYRTAVEPSLQADQGKHCRLWVSLNGKQYCSPDLDEEPWGNIRSERYVSPMLQNEEHPLTYTSTDELPFDRILGNSSALPTIVYADLTMPRFKKFHKTISKTAKEGKTSYRLRHIPSVWAVMKAPLVVNGYGVELQLKRTDYIVIDDRQAEQGEKVANQKPLATGLDGDEDVSDLKPLSKDDVPNLALNAASFVMSSEQPMDTLLKLVQDFPKYTSTIAGRNASADFIAEHSTNREVLLPPGSNVIWINGVQIPAREVNPHALLAHMRRERKLINGVRGQGLSASDAVSLLSHSAITEGQSGDDVQRYDFRDTAEGGNTIIWMNNIEKDSRYESWSTELRSVSSHLTKPLSIY